MSARTLKNTHMPITVLKIRCCGFGLPENAQTVVITEQASGLKENRRGLKKLFKLVSRDQVDVVMVEFKDRLARFGFAYIQEALRFRGGDVEVLELQESKDAAQEMVQDMLAIVAVFAVYLDLAAEILNHARAFYINFFLAHSFKFDEIFAYYSEKLRRTEHPLQGQAI